MSDVNYRYKYLVDHNNEITLEFPVEGSQGGLRVQVHDPKWKPGNYVVLDQETMDGIIEGLFNYTQTGVAPNVASQVPRDFQK